MAKVANIYIERESYCWMTILFNIFPSVLTEILMYTEYCLDLMSLFDHVIVSYLI